MSIDLLIEDPSWSKTEIANWAQTGTDLALTALGLSDRYEITVLACDDAKITELNAQFRGKPTPTNVLSWPAYDLGAIQDGEKPGLPPPPDGFDDTLGDIAIAYEICIAEARAQGKPLAPHVTHLILHATLHLLGYDHIRPKDADLMENVENKALASIGISNPY